MGLINRIEDAKRGKTNKLMMDAIEDHCEDMSPVV